MSGIENLAGKIAVVTGGASGIGRGIASCLIAQGMKVVIADIEQKALDSTAAAIGATGIHTDVSSLDSVRALADQVQRRFGAVHVVCNNAGVGSVAPLQNMTSADWQWLLGVNLWGVIHGVNAFLPMLKANADGGHIVNTASMGGLATLRGLGGYTTTKFAVVAFSETLASELEQEGSRVGVTVLCPGPVRSNIKSSHRNRPASLPAGGLVDSDLEHSEEGAAMPWLEPEQVGEVVVRAIRRSLCADASGDGGHPGRATRADRGGVSGGGDGTTAMTRRPPRPGKDMTPLPLSHAQRRSPRNCPLARTL